MRQHGARHLVEDMRRDDMAPGRYKIDDAAIEKARYLLDSGLSMAEAVFLVGRGRLELPTNGLKVRCSTN